MKRSDMHRDLGKWFEDKIQQTIEDLEMRCRAVDMEADDFNSMLMAEFSDRVVQIIAALNDPDNDKHVLSVLYTMVQRERAKRAQEDRRVAKHF